MRVLLAVLSLTFVSAKRFVLLDPDDPNIDKAASSITDDEVRTRSVKMAKFRKWLKYDVDCEFVTREELEIKISHGKCPYEPKKEKTTTTTKEPKSFFFKRNRKPIIKSDKSIFSHDNKEMVVRAVVGNNKMQDINWTPTSLPYLELVGGSMVTFLCDEDDRRKNRKKNTEVEFIEWFVNGRRITPSWFDWRVSVSSDGRLGIWPIGVDDSGQFECLANGQLRASVTVNVIPVSSILISGLLNYLFVCAIFAVATISMGCLLGNRNQERKVIEVDRMEEFLAESVFQTDQMAKDKIAGIIEKQGLVDERQLIENKAKSNRSTIMILLKKPKLENLEKENRSKNNGLNNPRPSSTDDEGTATTVTDGTTIQSASGTNRTTNATGTTTIEFGTTNESAAKTNDTETGTTITKTEEEDGGGDGKDGNINVEGGENETDEDESDDVASGTTSRGPSTSKNKPTKGAKKGGKNTKKAKGKGNTKKTKYKEKGKKKSSCSKAKPQKTKHTTKKAPSKPTKKMK